MAITLSYEEFFAKRDLLNVGVDYEEQPSFYLLEMSDGPRINRCEVAKDNEFENLEFVSRYKNKCNQVVLPKTVNISSHDFSNTATWIPVILSQGAVTSSLYTYIAFPTKKLALKHIKFAFSELLEFENDQEVKVVLWEGITQICPETDYLNPTPYNQPDQGWIQNYPPPIHFGQEVKIYTKVEDNVELYKVTEFTYPSVNAILKKARPIETRLVKKATEVDPAKYEHLAYYMYQQEKIILQLRSSFRERMEFFIPNHVPLDNGNSGVESVVTVVFDVYNEW